MAEKDKDEKSKRINWNLVIYGVLFLAMIGAVGDRVEIAVPIAGMAMIVAPFFFWYKRRTRRDELEIQQKAGALANPEKDAQFKRMQERVENLEAMMCNLDREINLQMEKSLRVTNMLASMSNPAGVSQMPTTFMNVASALEGRYQVLQELGRGGMGIVFQAHDKQLNDQVAIKILSPLLSNDADALDRMKREVSAARRITHPNVIRIHDIAESKGLHYVSMEYFHGTSLKEYIKRSGSLSLMQAYNIASQICDGLEEAHKQGVIHRDLKSQNIIINPSGHLKIIDFGLAHTAHLQGMTATGLIMGTPEYMAPEQVAGKRVDERADIYSLGIILYELFTGKVPFSGDSAIAVGFMQMKDPPQPPHEINPQIPPEIESVILKCLEKEPNGRFGSVVQVKAALQNAVHAPAQDLSISRSQRDQERVQIKN
jgi:eukaryotic-like serine/threonine-protein kinase